MFMGGLARTVVATQLLTRGAARAASGGDALAGLAPGHARRLGPYANRDFEGGAAITDYSSITFDAAGRRMCLFGGGHGPSQETDIRVLDLDSLSWRSLYAPTPAHEMVRANCDADLGRYRSTNQPTARHTYNLTLVRDRRFYMLAYRGMPDHLDGVLGEANGWGGRICWYDFDAQEWSYSRIAMADTPWYFGAAAALDPVSRKIVVTGPNAQGGAGGVWFYDPVADAIEEGPPLEAGAAADIVYLPATDRFVVLQSDGRVWEIAYDRANAKASRAAAVEVRGTRPAARAGIVCGYAYDPRNRVIGGNVIDGWFHAYDPATQAWSRTRMRVDDATGARPSQAFHCLDFDSASGCFVFLETPAYGARAPAATWAYRHVGAAATPRAIVGDLRVELDFGADGTAVFDGARAVDMGTYQGELVRQASYLCTDPSFPDWRVWLRVDVNGEGARIAEPAPGWRDEVVVEYGRTRGGAAHRERGYVARIRKGDAPVAIYDVPRHWWYARWRHASSPRDVVRTPAALRARGWIPALGREGLFGAEATAVDVAWPGPMGTPARPAPTYPFNPVMADGGDHEEIGFLTEHAASYAIFGGAAALRTLRSEGEWCGNWCMHIRDDDSGEMPDFRDLESSFASDGGAIADAPRTGTPPPAGFVALDSAHWYPCANLPWLLTDDPYLLEELQFGVNWRILWNRTARVTRKLGGLVYPGETRSLAWGLRDLFLLAATTPERVPAWLRPRSHWQTCLDDHLTFALQFVHAPARVHALFRAWPRSDMIRSWMSAWLSAVVGMAVDQGFEEWRPVFEWSIDAQIQMTNGTSGWPRQWPAPYGSTPVKTPGYYGTFDQYPHGDTALDAATCATWGEYWAWYASGTGGRSDDTGHTIDTTGWDGHTLMAQFERTGYASFFLHLRAALAVAVSRRVPGARACYDYLQAELATAMAQRYRAKGQARFSIDPVDVPSRAVPPARSRTVSRTSQKEHA